MSRVALAAALALMLPTLASAAETLHVYGPGGLMPAMKEAATVFGAAHGITVEVTAGPTPAWIEKARADADLVFSGPHDLGRRGAARQPGVPAGGRGGAGADDPGL